MFFYSYLTALRLYELFKYRAVYKYILLSLFKLQISRRANKASYLSLRLQTATHIAKKVGTKT